MLRLFPQKDRAAAVNDRWRQTVDPITEFSCLDRLGACQAPAAMPFALARSTAARTREQRSVVGGPWREHSVRIQTRRSIRQSNHQRWRDLSVVRPDDARVRTEPLEEHVRGIGLTLTDEVHVVEDDA